MKNTCLFCVPILVGAKLIGFTSLIYHALTLIIFGRIYYGKTTWVLDRVALYEEEKMQLTVNAIESLTGKFIYNIFYLAIAVTSIQFISCFLMICGLKCQKRGMMTPYIFTRSIKNVLNIFGGIYLIYGMYVNRLNNPLHYIIIAVATVLMIWVGNLYFQFLVFIRAYRKMSDRGVVIEPANYETLNGRGSYQSFLKKSNGDLYADIYA